MKQDGGQSGGCRLCSNIDSRPRIPLALAERARKDRCRNWRARTWLSYSFNEFLTVYCARIRNWNDLFDLRMLLEVSILCSNFWIWNVGVVFVDSVVLIIFIFIYNKLFITWNWNCIGFLYKKALNTKSSQNIHQNYCLPFIQFYWKRWNYIFVGHFKDTRTLDALFLIYRSYVCVNCQYIHKYSISWMQTTLFLFINNATVLYNW